MHLPILRNLPITGDFPLVPEASKEYSAFTITVMRWNNCIAVWDERRYASFSSVVPHHLHIQITWQHRVEHWNVCCFTDVQMYELFQSSWMWRRLAYRHQWVNSNLLRPSELYLEDGGSEFLETSIRVHVTSINSTGVQTAADGMNRMEYAFSGLLLNCLMCFSIINLAWKLLSLRAVSEYSVSK
jgi:hypothetical protein